MSYRPPGFGGSYIGPPVMQPSLPFGQTFSYYAAHPVNQNTAPVHPGVMAPNNNHCAPPAPMTPNEWADNNSSFQQTAHAHGSNTQNQFMAGGTPAGPASVSNNGANLWPVDVFGQHGRADVDWARPSWDNRVSNGSFGSQGTQQGYPQYPGTIGGVAHGYQPLHSTAAGHYGGQVGYIQAMPNATAAPGLHGSQAVGRQVIPNATAASGIQVQASQSNAIPVTSGNNGPVHQNPTPSGQPYNTNQANPLSLQAVNAARNRARAILGQRAQVAGLHNPGQPVDPNVSGIINRPSRRRGLPPAVTVTPLPPRLAIGQSLQGGTSTPILTEFGSHTQSVVTASPEAVSTGGSDLATVDRSSKREEQFDDFSAIPLEILNMVIVQLLGDRDLTITLYGGVWQARPRFRLGQKSADGLLRAWRACRLSCKLISSMATEVFFKTNRFDFQEGDYQCVMNTYEVAQVWLSMLPVSCISILTNVAFTISLNRVTQLALLRICVMLRKLGNSRHLRWFKLTLHHDQYSPLPNWEPISKVLEEYRTVETPLIEFVPAKPQISGPLQCLMSKRRRPGLGGCTRILPVRSMKIVEFHAILSWRKKKPETFVMYAQACGLNPDTTSLIPTAIARQIALYIRDDRSRDTMPGPLVESHEDAKKMKKTKRAKKTKTKQQGEP